MKEQEAPIALGYNPKSPDAPKVLATGLAEIAKKYTATIRVIASK